MPRERRRVGLVAAALLVLLGVVRLVTVSGDNTEGPPVDAVAVHPVDSVPISQPRGARVPQERVARPSPSAASCLGARALLTQGCTVATRSGRYLGSFKERNLAFPNCRAVPPRFALTRCDLTRSGRVSLALVGNSRAAQWSDALKPVAQQQRWQVTAFLASSCAPIRDRIRYGDPAESAACQRWGRQVQKAIIEGGFDYVLFSSSANQLVSGKDHAASFAAWFRPLVDAGVGVVVLRAVERNGPSRTDLSDCLRRNRSDYRRCAGDARTASEPDAAVVGARQLGSTQVTTMTMTDLQCTSRSCPIVIGGVLAYYDRSHLTPTYVRTTLPWFRSRLVAAVEAVSTDG